MLRKMLAMAALGLVALSMTACNPVTKLNLTIEVEESFRKQLADAGGRKILVDVVAIGPTENKRWQDYSMTQYWGAGDPQRASKESQRKTLTIDPAKADPQTIKMEDEAWKVWLAGANDKAPPRLYVLAQLPKPDGTIWSTSDDKPDNQDPRRQILPLGKNRWATTNVRLQVTKTGIITLTPPKPDKTGM